MSFSDISVRNRSVSNPNMGGNPYMSGPMIGGPGGDTGSYGQYADYKPVTDWASVMTLGMFSLAHQQGQRSAMDQISSSYFRKVKRKGVELAGDHFLNKGFAKDLHTDLVRNGVVDPKKWEEYNARMNQYSYSGLLGIGRRLATDFDAKGVRIPINPETGVAAERGVASFSNWRRAIAENFDVNANKLANASNGAVQLTASNFAKYTTTGNMFRGITNFMATGKGAVSAGLYGVSFGFMLANIGQVGATQWRESRAAGEGWLSSAFKTVVAVGKETFKSIASFEAGGLAYTLGYALCAVNPLAGLAGGMLFATLGQSLAYRALNSTVGDSIDHPTYQPSAWRA